MTVWMYTVVATAQRIVATHTTTAPTWAKILVPTARNYGSGGGGVRLRLRPALLGSYREHDIVSVASGAARLRQLWDVPIRLLRWLCVSSHSATGSVATFAQPTVASEYVFTAKTCYGYARFAFAVLVQAKLRPA